MASLDTAELNELVNIFQILQRAEPASQITERNVVDIVNLIIKKNLVELVYTTDAKEYLTRNALKREIIDEVYASCGRLNVVDLPGLLSVHPRHVEEVLPEVLEETPSLRLEGNELMTDQYLREAVQSASDALNEQGSLPITNFASQHQFSSVFAMQILTAAVQEGRLDAVIQDSVFYTKRYVISQKIILRSGLLAATQPLDLVALYKRHQLFTPLMDTLISELQSELPGVFQGYIYTPSAFERYRTGQITNIYTSNGYIDYAAVQRLGITNARQYLLSHYNPTSGPAEALPPGDAAPQRRGGKRKTAHKDAQKRAHVVAPPMVCATAAFPLCGHALGGCFLSDRHLANLVALHPIAEAEVAAVDITQIFPTCVDLEKDWPLLHPRLCDLYPGLDKCDLIDNVVLIQKDLKAKIRPLLMNALESRNQSVRSKKKADSQSPEELIIKVISEKLELNLEQYAGVLREIADRWSDFIEDIVQQADTLRENKTASEAKELRQSIISKMTNTWIELVVVSKGIQWAKLQFDEDTNVVLNRHVLGDQAYELCRDVFLNESLDNMGLYQKVCNALDQVTNISNLQKALAPFPANDHAALKPIIDALKGKELGTLMDLLQSMSSVGNIAIASFHVPNKKLERDTYTKMKMLVVAEVQETSFGDNASANGVLFAALCTVLIHQLFHVHLRIPGKIVRAVVAHLTKESNAPADLTAVHEAVLRALKSGHVDAESLGTLNLFREQVLKNILD
ncbi:unnamed protein product [Phytomonas sp. Hart1]|nr:unnamed protein product [Phytomonas sp. Hart1]|eukprot:CCW70096.1 unnamed protein product [Phytomonas sp. isolate Hart1]